MTSGSHGLTYEATDESKSAPKFEVESYFVHHTLANKIALNLEFWSTFDHSYEPRKVEKVQKTTFCKNRKVAAANVLLNSRLRVILFATV